LGLNISYSGMGILGISFKVTIFDLIEENWFFNSLFFKFSGSFKATINTFLLSDKTFNIALYKKLEYDEVVKEDYPIRPNSKDIFDGVIAKDLNSAAKVIVSTTIGEVYNSDEFRIDNLLENYKHTG